MYFMLVFKTNHTVFISPSVFLFNLVESVEKWKLHCRPGDTNLFFFCKSDFFFFKLNMKTVKPLNFEQLSNYNHYEIKENATADCAACVKTNGDRWEEKITSFSN